MISFKRKPKCSVCGKRINLTKEGESYEFDPLRQEYTHLSCKKEWREHDLLRSLRTKGVSAFKREIGYLKFLVSQGDDDAIMDFLNRMTSAFFTAGIESALRILEMLSKEAKDETEEHTPEGYH